MIGKVLKSMKSVALHMRISGTINASVTERVQLDIEKLRYRAPKMIAVSVNAWQGGYPQAELIVGLLKKAQSTFDCPIYTFAEDLCLGPGYYILSIGNKVFADANSLVGGLYVTAQSLGLKGLAANAKITPQIITSGENKNRLSPFEDVKTEDEKWIMDLMQERVSNLHKFVMKNRGAAIPRDKTVEDEVFSGEMFLGHKAAQIGLVDQLGEAYSVIYKEFHGLQIVRGKSLGQSKGPFTEEIMRAVKSGEASEDVVTELVNELTYLGISNRLETYIPYNN